ncbi:hypothetical protein B566_EDAN018576, partial [Ephemera danica]
MCGVLPGASIQALSGMYSNSEGCCNSLSDSGEVDFLAASTSNSVSSSIAPRNISFNVSNTFSFEDDPSGGSGSHSRVPVGCRLGRGSCYFCPSPTEEEAVHERTLEAAAPHQSHHWLTESGEILFVGRASYLKQPTLLDFLFNLIEVEQACLEANAVRKKTRPEIMQREGAYIQ